MKLTFIDCSCGNTKGFQLADNIAECTSCATPVHIDTPTYHTYELDSLSDIEQRAKHYAMFEIWLEPESEQLIDMIEDNLIDWSTCFDTDNIRVAV